MVNMNHFENPAVYALHGGDGRLRYVGSTRVNSTNRMYQHAYRARAGHQAPVYKWMREVGIGKVQIIDLLHETDLTTLAALEQVAIEHLIAEGHDLVNSLHGRAARGELSEKTKARLAGAERARQRREFRAANPRPVKPERPLERIAQHGTRTEAEKYKCKCDPCRLVVAQRNAIRRGRPIPTVAPRQQQATRID